jgi:hypothetical protein
MATDSKKKEDKVKIPFITPPMPIKFEPNIVNEDNYGNRGLNLLVDVEVTKSRKFLEAHRRAEEEKTKGLKGTLHSIFKSDDDLDEETQKYEPGTNFILPIKFFKAPKVIDLEGNKVDPASIQWGDVVQIRGQFVSYEEYALKHPLIKDGKYVRDDDGDKVTDVKNAKGFSKYGNVVILVEKGEGGGMSLEGAIEWDDEEEDE